MKREIKFHELSLEAIEHEIWHSVYLPLPKTPSPELLKTTHWNAEYCYEAAKARAENPDWPGIRAFEPKISEYGRSDGERGHANAALERMEQCERLDPTLVRMLPAMSERDPADQERPSSDRGSDRTDLKSDTEPTSSSAVLDYEKRHAENKNGEVGDQRLGKSQPEELSDRMQRLLNSGSSEREAVHRSEDPNELGPRNGSGGGRSRSH